MIPDHDKRSVSYIRVHISIHRHISIDRMSNVVAAATAATNVILAPSPNETDADALDKEIMFLITKGNPSVYSVWSAMNRQMQGRGLAYVNVKKRVRRMTRLGYLDLTESFAVSVTKGIEAAARGKLSTPRGRIEYKVTMKGLEALIPYQILIHPEEIQTIIEYTDRFNQHLDMDKQAFADLLISRISSLVRAANQFMGYAKQSKISLTKSSKLEALPKEMNELSRLISVIPKQKVVSIYEPSVGVSDSVTATVTKAKPSGGHEKDGLTPEVSHHSSKSRRVK